MPFTYTDLWIEENEGAPSLMDIAVQLGGIPRFCRATSRFYSVLQHSMSVADLLSEELKIYGLLHDCSDLGTEDVPSPFKCDCLRRIEHKIQDRTIISLGLPLPTDEQRKIIKWADKTMVAAEGRVLGAPGLFRFPEFQEIDHHAENLVRKYCDKYSVLDTVEASGRGVQDFYWELKKRLPSGVNNAR